MVGHGSNKNYSFFLSFFLSFFFFFSFRDRLVSSSSSALYFCIKKYQKVVKSSQK